MSASSSASSPASSPASSSAPVAAAPAAAAPAAALDLVVETLGPRKKKRAPKKTEQKSIPLEEALMRLASSARKSDAKDDDAIRSELARLLELDAKHSKGKAVVLRVSGLAQRKFRDVVALVDMSGSIVYNSDVPFNSMTSLLEELKEKRREVKDSTNSAFAFGHSEKFDKRNAVHRVFDPVSFNTEYPLAGFLEKAWRRENCVSVTDPTSLQYAFEHMQRKAEEGRVKGGEPEPYWAFVFSDGGFSDASGALNNEVFPALVRRCSREFGALQGLTVVIPDGVPESVAALVKKALTNVLVVRDKQIPLSAVSAREMACNSEMSGEVFTPSYSLLPSGFDLLSEQLAVPSDARPEEIAISLRERDEKTGELVYGDEIVGMVTNLLELVKSNEQILDNTAYARVYAVYKLLRQLELRPGKTLGNQFGPLFSALGASSPAHKRRLDALGAGSYAANSVPTKILRALQVVSKLRVTTKPAFLSELHLVQKRVNSALADGSGLSLLALVEQMFGSGTPVSVEPITRGEGGWFIPSPARCPEQKFPYGEAVQWSVQTALASLGVPQVMFGQTEFAFCLFVLFSEKVEVEEPIRELVRARIFDKRVGDDGCPFLARRLGLDIQNRTIKLPDSFFSRHFAQVLRALCETDEFAQFVHEFPYLSPLENCVRGIYGVFREADIAHTLLKSPFSASYEENTAEQDHHNTVFIYHQSPTTTWKWKLCYPGVPNVVMNLPPQVADNGKQFLGNTRGTVKVVYLDNPLDPQDLEVANQMALAHFEDEAAARAYVGDLPDFFADRVHLNPSRLEPIGRLGREGRKEVTKMLMAWKLEDESGTKSAAEISRDLQARSTLLRGFVDQRDERRDGAPDQEQKAQPFVEKVRVELTAAEVSAVVDEALPWIRQFCGVAGRRGVENLVNVWHKLGPIQESLANARQGAGAASIIRGFRVIPHCVLEQVQAKYKELRAPLPVPSSKRYVECCICFEDTTRSCRCHMECGHAVCFPCQAGCVERVRQIQQEVLKEAHKGLAAAVAMASCPQCRRSPLLPDTVEFKALRRAVVEGLEGGVLLVCKGPCQKIFAAGQRGCNGEVLGGYLHEMCADCSSPLSFTCPSCDRKFQHDGGCNIMRCCGLGDDGCRGPGCEHRFCSCPPGGPCSDPSGHAKGCGMTWVIQAEERKWGNNA